MLAEGAGLRLRAGTGSRRGVCPGLPRSGPSLQHPPTLRLGAGSRSSAAANLALAPWGHFASGSSRGPLLVQQAVVSPEKAQTVVSKEFPLRNGSKVQVTVEATPDSSEQVVTLRTDCPAGRLLLHWGVEGGANYKGGWRLPAPAHRPEGTVQYKDRALQSPFKTDSSGVRTLRISLSGDEVSDVLNFVLKDEATNTWYDNNGSNFKCALRPDVDADAAPKIDVLPKDLCDKWSWVRWDFEGRPNRDTAAAQSEYDRGVKEMRALLDKGRTLDELWRVAEGKYKYMEYRKNVVVPMLGNSTAPASLPAKTQAPAPAPAPASAPAPARTAHIPDELVSVQAYVMWENAGKPDGADFAGPARAELEAQLAAGRTFEDICKQLKYTPKDPSILTSGGSMSSVDAPAAPSPQKQAAPAQVGQSLGTPKRNPLSMIKRGTDDKPPRLSGERDAVPEKPMEFLVQRFAVDSSTRWRRTYPLGSKAELLAAVRQDSPDQPVRLDLITDISSEVVLHWGVCKPGSRDWRMPEPEVYPEGSVVMHKAVETEFQDCMSEDWECDVEIAGAKVPLQRLTITLPPDHTLGGVTFVLRSSDSTMWYKDAGGNFFIPVPSKASPEVDSAADRGAEDDLSRAIIDAENSSAWTLMHRFNRAADLVAAVLDGKYPGMSLADAFSRIFVWLRYSATRQLTWQRNYNTQPRLLSSAQERITTAAADAHGRASGEAQEWARLILTNMGRGGDGQRIRDEILNIMHRNKIPERKGLWMEEWHQKLHNNTTPDDVPICEAYLAFLESNGNHGAYWRVLSDAGITRERLESFDRPITLQPEFYPEKKDALIRDFRNYLGILKACHSGADLQASASAAGNKIPGGARGFLGYVMSHVNDNQVLPLMEAAVEARAELASALTGNRELLYLDLSLEDQVRRAAERGVGSSGFGAAAFMKPLLQNLALSLGNNEEVCYCLKAWSELPASVTCGGRPSKEEALLAVAVINRIRRAISHISDSILHRIDAVGKAYGRAFGVPRWAYEVFAEEVIRGGPAFAVSLAITSIEPTLRNAAALGAWQVISPHDVRGVIDVVDDLSSVQEKTYETPTVLIANQVTGEEEIPEGVVAVITPDAPDVLSHVSVRARNMRVLFATCHDTKPLDELRAAKGKWMHFSTTASGAVNWSESQAPGAGGDAHSESNGAGRPFKELKITVPQWSGKWVVTMDEYRDAVVGAKSKNLAGLRGKLPESIKLPASITLPFGCFEQVLELPENSAIRSQLAALVAQVNGHSHAGSNGNGNGAHANGSGLISTITSAIKGGSNSSSNGSAAANGNGNGNGAHHAGDAPAPTAAALLAQCRELAMQVKVPKQMVEDLAAAMKTAGIPVPENEERWAAALEALKGVWASKYNDRAFYSLKKVGLNFDDVRMAVLVQRVVPAQYAFVIHTKNPSNNDETEVFCEMVKGLGESLVSGMVPGSAVAFKASKTALDKPEVLCYASKSEAMVVRDSLIFRSDSNGEDLEGYAGAGLYESITMDTTQMVKVDYMEDPLVTDPGFRKDIMSRICRVGYDIEKALGSAQDVEGVVDPDRNITVVQTRPQV